MGLAHPRCEAPESTRFAHTRAAGRRPRPIGQAGRRRRLRANGRTVARLLRDNGIEPVIIELNMETVRGLREEGSEAVYGDATKLETLEAAGAAHAATVILTSAGMGSASEVIRMARHLNPKVQVLARAQYLRDLTAMHAAGADRVFTGEGEVALGLIETFWNAWRHRRTDRSRARTAHRELFGKEAGA